MIEPTLIIKAIKTVNPNADRIHIQDENNYSATDSDGNEIVFDIRTETEIDRLIAEYDAQEYARNRATEYPAIADQLDEIYHNGIDSWKAVIKVTKDKYPKG